MKTIILVPYVASAEQSEVPAAEAKFLFEEHFKDSSYKQILGFGLEGRLYINGDVGLYIIGEGKTNASMYTTALLNNNEIDIANSNFVLFGCCGCAKGSGVVGDIYLIAEATDYDLGHHADARELSDEAVHTWFPNESFKRFGYLNLENEMLSNAFNLIKSDKALTTQNAKNYMAKTFNNEDWATRDPKILKATSVTSDSYWKGEFDHKNAQFIVDYYKCQNPFLATDMEDIAVAQVFSNHNLLDKLLVLRFAVNTDIFMHGQTPETLWGEGKGSFDSSSFDNFDDAFSVVTKCATDLLWKIINS